MKRILFVLTAALLMASCFHDPPVISHYMWHYETLCDTLTTRRIEADIMLEDTAKARAAGFTSR